MFSGLTNQVSSWIGAAKGEPQDEEVPTPPNSAATATVAPPVAATTVDTSAASAAAAAPTGDEGDKRLVTTPKPHWSCRTREFRPFTHIFSFELSTPPPMMTTGRQPLLPDTFWVGVASDERREKIFKSHGTAQQQHTMMPSHVRFARKLLFRKFLTF